MRLGKQFIFFDETGPVDWEKIMGIQIAQTPDKVLYVTEFVRHRGKIWTVTSVWNMGHRAQLTRIEDSPSGVVISDTVEVGASEVELI